MAKSWPGSLFWDEKVEEAPREAGSCEVGLPCLLCSLGKSLRCHPDPLRDPQLPRAQSTVALVGSALLSHCSFG